MTTKVAMLLLGDLKLAVGPGVLTVFDFYKVDVPLIWVELTGIAGLECGWSGCGWRWVLPVPPTPPCTSQIIRRIRPWRSFQRNN